MLDYVTARVMGTDLKMKIDRGDLPVFEAAEGVSAFVLYRTFRAGHWTIANIQAVLRFANLPAVELARLSQIAKHIPGHKPIYGTPHGPDTTFVDRALRKNPPAVYAPLAMAILGAALFGISEEEAIFTDEPDAEAA